MTPPLPIIEADTMNKDEPPYTFRYCECETLADRLEEAIYTDGADTVQEHRVKMLMKIKQLIAELRGK